MGTLGRISSMISRALSALGGVYMVPTDGEVVYLPLSVTEEDTVTLTEVTEVDSDRADTRLVDTVVSRPGQAHAGPVPRGKLAMSGTITETHVALMLTDLWWWRKEYGGSTELWVTFVDGYRMELDLSELDQHDVRRLAAVVAEKNLDWDMPMKDAHGSHAT